MMNPSQFLQFISIKVFYLKIVSIFLRISQGCALLNIYSSLFFKTKYAGIQMFSLIQGRVSLFLHIAN